jgi:hypothetical protein
MPVVWHHRSLRQICAWDTLARCLLVMVYEYVLNTTKCDNETQSHVYETGERQVQNLALRLNNFTRTNVRHQHFALLGT